MSKSYHPAQFDNELAKMLREASAQHESRECVIVSRDLHARVVNHAAVIPPNERRMPMACAAMWRRVSKQGGRATVIRTSKSGQTSKLVIKFDITDLPERTQTRRTNR